jgi:hypothetical protein
VIAVVEESGGALAAEAAADLGDGQVRAAMVGFFRGCAWVDEPARPPLGGQAGVPGRTASRSSCSFLEGGHVLAQSLLSGYDEVSARCGGLGHLEGPVVPGGGGSKSRVRVWLSQFS